MEKNQIKICCDPYHSVIEYYWLEEDGRWSDLGESDYSQLNNDKYINASLSHIAYPLLDILVNDYYNDTIGLGIVFEGTDDDFNDLNNIKNSYFSDYDIEIIKGNRMMSLAKDVKPEIEAIFGGVESFFREYPDKCTEEIILKYRETVKPEIALCVMGLYSSGKSAFINSLIGNEILPSDSDPATAKVYRIEDSEESEVRFVYKKKEYKVQFTDNSWKSLGNTNNEIISSLKAVIEDKKPETVERYMYLTLSVLNNFAREEGSKQHTELVRCANEMLSSEELSAASTDEKKVERLLGRYRIKELIKQGKVSENKLGPIIGVNCAFDDSYMPTDKFKFVIYDTPGSNSVQFREHVDILKESLEQQTNGLPLFVTTPDTMDGTDNNELIQIINELGGSLDVPNMMLVVNKADEKARDTLKEKADNIDNLVLTKWANRVYFVSSIMGLGGKKESKNSKVDWIHPDYKKTYRTNKYLFEDPDEEDYMRLFEYNILPVDEVSRINERVKKLESTELLKWNSGIPCVEEEIGIFAEKYALYNKCSQAIVYLTDAIESLSGDIENALEEASKIQDDIEAQYDDEKASLIKKIDDKCEEKLKKFQADFSEKVLKDEMNSILDEKRIEKTIKEIYDKQKGANDHEKLKGFNDGVEQSLRQDLKNYSRNTSEKNKKYWEQCESELKSDIMQIVKDSPTLSEEDKQALKNVMTKIRVSDFHKTLDIINTSAVKNKDSRFLGFLWYLTKIEQKEAKAKYKESLNKDIGTNNKATTSNNEIEFRRWKDGLVLELNGFLASMNPELVKLSQQLMEQKEVIERKYKQKDYVAKSLRDIDSILDFKEV